MILAGAILRGLLTGDPVLIAYHQCPVSTWWWSSPAACIPWYAWRTVCLKRRDQVLWHRTAFVA